MCEVRRGAAAEAETGEMVTCSHCGTAFKLPTDQIHSGGVNISGGSVTVGGDIVGGDLVKISPTAPKLSWQEKIKRLLTN